MAGFGMSARLGAMSLIGIVALAGVGIDAVLAQSTSSEAALWSSVRNSGRAADLERYLKSYPAGEYAPLARLKLRVARKTENRESVRTETKARESEDAKKSPQKPKKSSKRPTESTSPGAQTPATDQFSPYRDQAKMRLEQQLQERSGKGGKPKSLEELLKKNKKE